MINKIHTSLPEGFHWADVNQTASFLATCSVPGASKVAVVAVPVVDLEIEEYRLAVRLRPPFKVEHVTRRALIAHNALALGMLPGEVLPWYLREYREGWNAHKKEPDLERSGTSHAFDDGYLDHQAGRPKWHLTWCEDHDSLRGGLRWSRPRTTTP